MMVTTGGRREQLFGLVVRARELALLGFDNHRLGPTVAEILAHGGLFNRRPLQGQGRFGGSVDAQRLVVTRFRIAHSVSFAAPSEVLRQNFVFKAAVSCQGICLFDEVFPRRALQDGSMYHISPTQCQIHFDTGEQFEGGDIRSACHCNRFSGLVHLADPVWSGI
jgi:hypothetical protein